MPPSEEVPTDRYRIGQRIRLYVYDVRRSQGRMLQIMVSRTHRDLVRRLFESEVPEIYEGTVEIKAIAREPGSRSKVAVVARQEGLDPIGSCVGVRGSRINNIVHELNDEKIDIIQWSADPAHLRVQRAQPGKTSQGRAARNRPYRCRHRSRTTTLTRHRQRRSECPPRRQNTPAGASMSSNPPKAKSTKNR